MPVTPEVEEYKRQITGVLYQYAAGASIQYGDEFLSILDDPSLVAQLQDAIEKATINLIRYSQWGVYSGLRVYTRSDDTITYPLSKDAAKWFMSQKDSTQHALSKKAIQSLAKRLGVKAKFKPSRK